MFGISYTITLNQAEAQVLGLAALLSVFAWAWGALLRAGLGLNRWWGLLMLIPIVNVIAFLAAGAIAHRRLADERIQSDAEKIKLLLQEAPKPPVRTTKTD